MHKDILVCSVCEPMFIVLTTIELKLVENRQVPRQLFSLTVDGENRRYARRFLLGQRGARR